MNQPHKMKPWLLSYQKIDGLHSFRQFSKKNLKSLSRFTIVKPYPNNQNLKFHMLKRILSTFKSTKHLDLSSFDFQQFRTSQLKSIVKRFNKMQRFSGPRSHTFFQDNATKESLFLPFLILKTAKLLRDLSLELSLNHLPQQFLNLMHLCKIKSLQLTQMQHFVLDEGIKVNLSKYLPPTLERFSLFWDLDGVNETAMEFQPYPFSINHLKNLEKLELKLTLALDDFQDILKSISDPSKLKILRFDLTKEKKEDNCIEGLLGNFSNLEALEIRTGTLPVMGFYLETADMKLKELKVHHCLQNDDPLKLGEMIKYQKDSLQNLCLSLTFGDVEPSKLFENIKLLQNLKKLQFQLTPSPSAEKIPSVAGSLAEVLEALDCLEGLDFEEDLQEEVNFGRLCQALVQHSKSLKSLRLSCQDQADLLMQTLKTLPRLEHLFLMTIKVEGPNFYSDLRDLVCEQNKGLNSVTVLENRQKCRNQEHENFIKMLHDIIRKPTMKNFCYWEDYDAMMLGYYEASNFPRSFLNLPDIIREVYHFDNLTIPPYTCKPLANSSNFNTYKWNI